MNLIVYYCHSTGGKIMQPNRYLLVRKQEKEIQKILNRMERLTDEVVF